MGRNRSVHYGLPVNVRARTKPTGELLYYYEMRGGRRIRLGADRDFAVRFAEQATSDSRPFNESVKHAERKFGVRLIPVGLIIAQARIFEGNCGVYFLIRAGTIVYVGRSRNVPRRIEQHAQRAKVQFDAYHMIACSHAQSVILERAYIEALDPIGNKASDPA